MLAKINVGWIRDTAVHRLLTPEETASGVLSALLAQRTVPHRTCLVKRNPATAHTPSRAKFRACLFQEAPMCVVHIYRWLQRSRIVQKVPHSCPALA